MISNPGWKNMAGIPLRYVSHISFARVEDDQVIAPPPPAPYANIFVEAPGLPENAVIIQVSHKVDFYNLWLLDQKGILQNRGVEIIIKHKPPSGMKKLMAAILPRLEYSVFDRGHLEAVYDPNERDLALREKPSVYLYDQERRVQS